MEVEVCPECRGECQLIGLAPPSKFPAVRKMVEEEKIVQDLYRCTECGTELTKNRSPVDGNDEITIDSESVAELSNI